MKLFYKCYPGVGVTASWDHRWVQILGICVFGEGKNCVSQGHYNVLCSHHSCGVFMSDGLFCWIRFLGKQLWMACELSDPEIDSRWITSIGCRKDQTIQGTWSHLSDCYIILRKYHSDKKKKKRFCSFSSFVNLHAAAVTITWCFIQSTFSLRAHSSYSMWLEWTAARTFWNMSINIIIWSF